MILTAVSDTLNDLAVFGSAVLKSTEEHDKQEILEYCQLVLEKIYVSIQSKEIEGKLLVKLKDDRDRPDVKQIQWALSEYLEHEWTITNNSYAAATCWLLDAVKSDYTLTKFDDGTTMIRWCE